MPSMPSMKEALALTKQGKLGEALGVIRRGLGIDQGSARPAPDGAERSRDKGATGPRTDERRQAEGTEHRPPFSRGFRMRPSPITRPQGAPVPDDLLDGGNWQWEAHQPTDGGPGMRYRVFLPKTLPSRPALVVMLHGCTQDPDDFATATRMTREAAAHGFVVAFPMQERQQNPQGCWNWFQPGHQVKGAGELGSFAGIVETLRGAHRIDDSKVFAAGLSAGGAAAANLGRHYPELIAKVGVHSGLPAGAARGLPGALKAMKQGASGDPQLGVPAIVFHGEADRTVAVGNGDALARQATAGRDVRVRHIPAGSPGAHARASLTIHEDAGTRRWCEYWRVEGGSHAWFGGDVRGSFTEDAGPDASAEMVRFFLKER